MNMLDTQMHIQRILPQLTLAKRSVNPDELKLVAQRFSKMDGPLMIIYIRHGRSAGNERDIIEELGDQHNPLKDHYRSFEDHDYPLVDIGRQQARSAGRYLAHLWNTGVIPGIDRTFCSPFIRTKETLREIVIGIKEYCKEKGINPERVMNGNVEITGLIGERYWHNFNKLPKDQQEEGYRQREEDPYYWIAGAAGEQIQWVSNRGRDLAQKVHRPNFKGKVLLVSTHGEFISASELAFHELDPFGEEFKASFARGIPNCGIYIYSRVPISSHMSPGILRGVGGFNYYMTTVPYELQGKRVEKFPDWTGEPTWRRKENRRIEALSFDEKIQVPEASKSLAAKLHEAGIGTGSVKSRA